MAPPFFSFSILLGKTPLCWRIIQHCFSSTEKHWLALAGSWWGFRSAPLAVLFPALIWDLSHTNTADSHATSTASSSEGKPNEPQKASDGKKMLHTQAALQPQHPRWTRCGNLPASVRQTEKNALRHSPLTSSHQALPVPQKRAITAQPVAELYVLNIYLFIYFLFCLCVLKSSAT